MTPHRDASAYPPVLREGKPGRTAFGCRGPWPVSGPGVQGLWKRRLTRHTLLPRIAGRGHRAPGIARNAGLRAFFKPRSPGAESPSGMVPVSAGWCRVAAPQSTVCPGSPLRVLRVMVAFGHLTLSRFA